MKELFILGIDPGTTVGYAILDIEGKLIERNSRKEITLSNIIDITTRIGKIIAVGTDKKKVPEFVDKLRIKLGANMFTPDEDLKQDEKRELSSNFSYRNDHEMDALASAVFAYKKITPLIKKVNKFTKDKKHLRNDILSIVLTKKISIFKAYEFLTRPKEEIKEERKVIEQEIDPKIKRLSEINAQLKKTVEFLRKENNEIKQKLKKDKILQKSVKKKIKKIQYDKNKENILQRREQNVINLSKELEKKERMIIELKKQEIETEKIISNMDEYFILKKLDTLSFNELKVKEKLLNIKKNDILYVTDMSIFSQNTIDIIKSKIEWVITSKKVPKELKSYFNIIEENKLKIIKKENFAFVKKESLRKEMNDISVLRKLVDDYKKRNY